MCWYHSGLGGFGARCPTNGESVVDQFVPQITRWREGGGWRFLCDRCGLEHDLPDLEYWPHAAFGQGALVFRDVKSAYLSAYAKAIIDDHRCEFSIVLHRPS